MYHFVEDKEFLKRAQNSCVEDLNKLVGSLLEEGISAQFILVGSGGRNMVTQNEDGDIDFDYNLLIQKCDDITDCRFLKETTRKALNKIMRKTGCMMLRIPPRHYHQSAYILKIILTSNLVWIFALLKKMIKETGID